MTLRSGLAFLGKFLLAHIAAVGAGYAAFVLLFTVLAPASGMGAMAFATFVVPLLAVVLLPFSLVTVVLLLHFRLDRRWIWVVIGGVFPTLYFITMDAWDGFRRHSEISNFPGPSLGERLGHAANVGLGMSVFGMVGGWVLWSMLAKPKSPDAQDEAAS